MRKQFLSMMAIAGITLLASCSNDEIVPAIDNGSNGVESEITLALSSGGDGMETRAVGRPVNSSAAASNVNKVQIKLYKNSGNEASANWEEASGVTFSGVAMTNGVMDWTALDTEGTPGYTDTGRDSKKTIKVKGLEAGSYKLIAYGYEDGHTYTIDGGTIDASNGMFKTAAITPAKGDNGDKVEEFFAGEATFEADADGKITTANVEVKMKRQVAGLLGYFYNIPIHKANAEGVMKQIKYVIVKTVANANQFWFPHTATNKLNGISHTKGSTVLLEYDLSALITTSTGTGGDDYQAQVDADNTNDKTFAINEVNTGDVQTVANSILGGRFVIPFSEHVAENTLTVELADTDGNTVRSWNVKINKENAGSYTGNTTQYDILRNHFYSIGKKLKSGDTNGGETPGPGVDPTNPDTPVDLSQDNDIIVILNDAWDVVYDMGLGD